MLGVRAEFGVRRAASWLNFGHVGRAALFFFFLAKMLKLNFAEGCMRSIYTNILVYTQFVPRREHTTSSLKRLNS